MRDKKNVNLKGSGFAQRLATLREKLHLTKTDLANKAGLSYRTIHDLERERRDHIQEKTLMLLSEALDVSVDELLNRGANSNGRTGTAPGSAPVHRRLRIWLLAGFACLLLAGAAYGWHFARSHPQWTVDKNRTLTVRDVVFGTRLWGFSPDIKVGSCLLSPWRKDHLLVAITSDAINGGCLLNLDLATGDTIWVMRPDIDAAIRAFGAEDVLAANFACRFVTPIDVAGDGVPELAVTFIHRLYYPSLACLVNAEGHMISQYAVKGHIIDTFVGDLDGDGREEFVGAGTNNAKAYNGASIIELDGDHWSGASIDSLCNPWSSEPDSALYRLVLPGFPPPCMDLMQQTRLHAREFRTHRNPDNTINFSLCVGSSVPDHADMIVFLDHQLHPLDCEPSDYFREKWFSQWPDSLTTADRPNGPAWWTTWLTTAKRFEAGHWPPPSGM